jgi:DNA-binding FadR family transcriptional regulator/nitroreductase
MQAYRRVPLAAGDVTVTLIARFKKLLATGALTPGSKLPPERELSQRFGVSRGSLRQALKVLVIMGVVTQRVGRGTFLADTAAAVLAEPLDFLLLFGSVSQEELGEARLIIEPELAAQAAERVTSDNLEALRASLHAMETAGSDRAALAQADVDFHRAIFHAAGNRVCESMLGAIQAALSSSVGRMATLTDVHQNLRMHYDIYSAISRCDPEAARRSMLEHLLDSRSLWTPSGEAAVLPAHRRRQPRKPNHQPLEFHRLAPEDQSRAAREFYERIRTRRTVRQFSGEAVALELIENAIRCASSAPSGANQQPWRFVVVRDPEIKHQIRLAAEAEERENYERRFNDEWLQALAPLGTGWHKEFLDSAPYLIVVFRIDYGLEDGRKRKHYYVQESVGIAVGFLLAALHLSGLATLTYTPSPMGFLTRILGRPENERPFVLIPVGYPAPDASVPVLAKKPLEEVLVLR